MSSQERNRAVLEFRHENAPHLYSGEAFNAAERAAIAAICTELGNLAATERRARQVIQRAMDITYRGQDTTDVSAKLWP